MACLYVPTQTTSADIIEIRDILGLPGLFEAKTKEFLTQKYIKEGLSIKQIAEEISSSRSFVWDALKRFEIPIRSRSEGQKKGHKSQAKYGIRMVNGFETSHLGEQRVIVAAKEMHELGLSLRKIAQILTKMGAPTKCQGRSWHPEMVSRILKF
ncbi:MAG: recombinase family protein [Bdellovibrio sp.]|nr:recombinase family protein [Bdellovibrio sp.]